MSLENCRRLALRFAYLYAAGAAIALAIQTSPVVAQVIVRSSTANLDMTDVRCWGQSCEFNHGAETYRIDRSGDLSREGRYNYRREVFSREGHESLRGAALSAQGNVLALAIANTTNSRRAFAGPARPDDLDRSFTVHLHNPKTGWLIKSIQLGAFAPEGLSLSEDGVLLFMVGQDLERRTIKEVRVYNARSGAQAYARAVGRTQDIRLGSNGFEDSGDAFVVKAPEGAGTRVYHSRDPFSVAEYEISCSGEATKGSLTLGVALVQDDATNQGEALAGAIAAEFKRRGNKVVERTRLKELLEELQLDMSGLVAGDGKVRDLNQLRAADLLVLGSISSVGGNFNGAFRSVSVLSGQAMSSCNLICRDCLDRDLYEGVMKLAEHWSGN